MDRKAHWDRVYATKASDEVSWFQSEPTVSLWLLERSGLTETTCVIDIGGGDSHLVDRLVARGLRCVTVLDVSAAALTRVRARLGAHADLVLFDPATVGPRPERTLQDLPGNASRIVVESRGVHRVIVAGTEIVRDETWTGATPGTVLRSGRDTETVTPSEESP